LAHDYTVNYDNVLGTGGELTEAYHDLLVEMWRGSYSTVAPRNFKYTLGKHAEQFMGFDQHDSQEFLGYLLDKIHEDLNRVERKPYVEQVEAKPGEEDEKVAGLSWDNHLLRNDSIVVDIFHGQYKSVVTCPNEQCGRVSITFDPFMSLTTPLPNSKSRELVVTLIPADGSITPIRFSLSVNKFASLGSVK
jgi:ubiquitin carboxyl-terminal hydrolase 4/11/15